MMSSLFAARLSLYEGSFSLAERLAIAGAIFSFCATVACGPSRDTVLQNVAAQNDQLKQRASFDMQCPKESLEILPIKQVPTTFHSDILYTTTAGVKGCSKQATYLWDDNHGVWVLNADTQPTAKQ